MARLLIDGSWYESVPAPALYETEYTRLILQSAADLFPTFHLVLFNPIITYAAVDKAPDLALIDRSYREWWVVEVERSDHNLFHHVLPQVEVFARGSYGVDEAEHLIRKAPELDERAIREMMRGLQPRVLVISNADDPTWRDAFARYQALLTVVEVFRSKANRHVLRLNGDYPDLAGDVLSICRVDPLMPRLLIVESPATIKDVESPIQIDYGGAVSRWSKVGASDRVWLTPHRSNPVELAAGPLVLLRTEDGRFKIEPVKKQQYKV